LALGNEKRELGTGLGRTSPRVPRASSFSLQGNNSSPHPKKFLRIINSNKSRSRIFDFELVQLGWARKALWAIRG
jgi:hypothetical protein